MRRTSDRRTGPPVRLTGQAGVTTEITLGDNRTLIGDRIVETTAEHGVALLRDLAGPVRAGVAACGAHAVDAETHTDAVRLVELGVCASAVIAEPTCGLLAPPGPGRVHWHADGLTVIARDLADLAATLPLLATARAGDAPTPQPSVGAHTDSLPDPRVRDLVGDVAARLSLGGVPVTDLDAGGSSLLRDWMRRLTRPRRAGADDEVDVVLTSVPPPEVPGRAGIVVTFPFGPQRAGRAGHVQLRTRQGAAADAVLALLRAVDASSRVPDRVA